MNKIQKFLVLVLSTAALTTAIFADYSYTQENYPYDSYGTETEMVGDGSWETSSSRMNRQGASAANPGFNPNQNRNEPRRLEPWETASGRMNRQANESANRPFNPSQVRNDPWGNDPWETSSERMNRQAGNIHSTSTR